MRVSESEFESKMRIKRVCCVRMALTYPAKLSLHKKFESEKSESRRGNERVNLGL